MECVIVTLLNNTTQHTNKGESHNGKSIKHHRSAGMAILFHRKHGFCHSGIMQRFLIINTQTKEEHTMAKYNYMVTASFIADKCRKVNTTDTRFYHFTVGKYDLMHDSDEGALYVKTPKLGLLISFVSLDSVKRHLDSGHLSQKLISDYIATRGGKARQSWPDRAEQARQWLAKNINI